MTAALKDLDEFNVQRRRMYTNNPPQPNGIACPKCGKELIDSNPKVTLTSNPPQKNVDCPWCGYRGHRIA